MQCEKFEQRLHQLLDERARPEDDFQLRRHAEQCPACHGMLLGQDALWKGLSRLAVPPPSADFVSAVLRDSSLAVLRQAPSKHNPRLDRRARRWAIAAALATAILLTTAPAAYWATRLRPQPRNAAVVVEGNSLNQNTGPTDSSTAAASSPMAAERLEATIDSPALELDAKAREERYAQWLEQWRMDLPKLGDRLGLNDADAPTVRGAAAVSALTDRLRSPVSASIESTLNVLRAALPSSTTEQYPAKPQAGVFDPSHQFLS